MTLQPKDIVPFQMNGEWMEGIVQTITDGGIPVIAFTTEPASLPRHITPDRLQDAIDAIRGLGDKSPRRVAAAVLQAVGHTVDHSGNNEGQASGRVVYATIGNREIVHYSDDPKWYSERLPYSRESFSSVESAVDEVLDALDDGNGKLFLDPANRDGADFLIEARRRLAAPGAYRCGATGGRSSNCIRPVGHSWRLGHLDDGGNTWRN